MGRFQLNALIERDTGGFGYFDAISEERVFLPFAWMDEGVEGPSEVGFFWASSINDVRKSSQCTSFGRFQPITALGIIFHLIPSQSGPEKEFLIVCPPPRLYLAKYKPANPERRNCVERFWIGGQIEHGKKGFAKFHLSSI